MATQLRYMDKTIEAAMIDESGLQPHVILLDKAKKYALVRVGNPRPDGCVPMAVKDPKVSSCHFILEYVDDAGHWAVTDGNGTKPSTNGTLVDMVKIDKQRTPLKPGCCISAKNSKVGMHFELTPEAKASAEAAEAKAAEAAAAAAAAAQAAAAKAAAEAEAATVPQEDTQQAAHPAPKREPEEPEEAGPSTSGAEKPPRDLIVYKQTKALELEAIGKVKISFSKKLTDLQREMNKTGLGSHFAVPFQFLEAVGGAQVPVWQQQHKSRLISELLQTPPDQARAPPSGSLPPARPCAPAHVAPTLSPAPPRVCAAQGVCDCVVVRATPPQEGRKEADDEEDSEAGVMPTWGANPGLAGCVSPATHTLGPRVGTGLPAARWRRRARPRGQEAGGRAQGGRRGQAGRRGGRGGRRQEEARPAQRKAQPRPERPEAEVGLSDVPGGAQA